MFRKRWMARVEVAELRARMPEVQRVAQAAGFRLEFVGAHHCGESEETILYADRGAQDRAQALCLQLDLNQPWGGGGQAVLVWGRARGEVVQAAGWLRSLELICDEVPPLEGTLSPAALYDFGLRQVGHAFQPATQVVLSAALASADPELREAAARVIGILRLDTALPELAAALEREEHADNRAVFQDAFGCLVGDAPEVRWLPGDFEAVCAQVMGGMPEQVVMRVDQPGASAWGGEPPRRAFELRACPALGGVTLEVFTCPTGIREALPPGVPEEERSLPVKLSCDPRYSAERYAAFAAALADEAADPSALLLAADEAAQRAQTWPLRLLAEHAQRFDPSQQARCEGLLALPQWLPDLPLTPPMLLAGLAALP